MRTFFLILFVLIYVCDVSNSCTQISIQGGESSGVDWIDGLFNLDKTLRIDDRLTYKEVNGTRAIYHYSGSIGESGSEANNKQRETGRWLLGSIDSIGTDNGWAYRLSWSISPDDLTTRSLEKNEDDPNFWKIFTNEEWIDAEDLNFVCETAFGDYDAMNDFLFVTTEDTFEDNELTSQNIHGYYVRISEDTFTKISGSKRAFYQEKANVSEIFVLKEASQLQSNGLPLATSLTNNKLSKVGLGGTWRRHTSDGKIVENVSVTVLQTDNDAVPDSETSETIYDLVRRYYRELKLEHKDIQVAELNNGMVLPMISLGTGGLTGVSESYRVIKEAVYQHGYSAIDSARLYESESAIGMLLTENKTLRAGLFLTSKVWPTDLYFQSTLDSVQKTLNSMKINYVDLYMINWPVCFDDLKFVDCSHSQDGKWEQSYDALLKLYGEGLILSIGVSNWNEDLMTELFEEFSVRPQVVQNLVDLNNLDWDFFDFLEENKILLQAYSTYRGLAEAKDPDYVELKIDLEGLLEEIEEEQGVKISMSQLVLRFLVENDIAVITRSSKTLHLKENSDLLTFEWNSEYNVRMGGRPEEKEEL